MEQVNYTHGAQYPATTQEETDFTLVSHQRGSKAAQGTKGPPRIGTAVPLMSLTWSIPPKRPIIHGNPYFPEQRQYVHYPATTKKVLLPTPQTGQPQANPRETGHNTASTWNQGQRSTYASVVSTASQRNPTPKTNPSLNPRPTNMWKSTNPNFALLVLMINKFLSILHHMRNWTTLPRKLGWGVDNLIDMVQLPCPDKSPDSLLKKLRLKWLQDLLTTGLDHLKQARTQIIQDLTKLNLSDFEQATEVAIKQLKSKYGSKFNMIKTKQDINELKQYLPTPGQSEIPNAMRVQPPGRISTTAEIHTQPKSTPDTNSPSKTEATTVINTGTNSAILLQTPINVEPLAGKRKERSGTASPAEITSRHPKKRNNDPDVEPSDSDPEEQHQSTVDRMKIKGPTYTANKIRPSHMVINEAILIEDDPPMDTNSPDVTIPQDTTDPPSMQDLTEPYQDSQGTIKYNYDQTLSQSTQIHAYISTTPTQTTPSKTDYTYEPSTPTCPTQTTPTDTQMIITKSIYTLRNTPTHILIITDQNVQDLRTNPTKINLAIFNKPKPTLDELCQALDDSYYLVKDGALPDLKAITLAIDPEFLIERTKRLKTICRKFHNMTEIIVLLNTAEGVTDPPVLLTQYKKTNGVFNYKPYDIDKSTPQATGIMTTLHILSNFYTSLNFSHNTHTTGTSPSNNKKRHSTQ